MHILMIDAQTIAFFPFVHFLLDPWKNLRGQLRILDHVIDWKSFILNRRNCSPRPCLQKLHLTREILLHEYLFIIPETLNVFSALFLVFKM